MNRCKVGDVAYFNNKAPEQTRGMVCTIISYKGMWNEIHPNFSHWNDVIWEIDIKAPNTFNQLVSSAADEVLTPMKWDNGNEEFIEKITKPNFQTLGV